MYYEGKYVSRIKLRKVKVKVKGVTSVPNIKLLLHTLPNDKTYYMYEIHIVSMWSSW